MTWDVVVVGAGAAGLLAAIRAAECGRRVLLLEKNSKPGVKILISGGTRCNLTHDTDARGIVAAYDKPGRFLHSALAALGPRELVQLVEAEGVSTKVEDTGKVFPRSDRAVDVLDALLRRLRRSGAELKLASPLAGITRTPNGFQLFAGPEPLAASRVIITTGGKSYPGCGTTGDGYVWAREMGHTIIPPRPALTPITTNAAWVADLKGITLPDVELSVIEPTTDGAKPRELDRRRGSFLFTHFGLSGPAPLDISRAITSHATPRSLLLVCDFLPAIKEEPLSAAIQRECESGGKRQMANIVGAWLPSRLAETVVHLAGMNADLRAAELSKPARQKLVQAMKRQSIPITGTRGFEKAEVTAGGVALNEVDSHTLESKLIPGLYFAGEILDLDGPIGGYNFQAAFSTGWLAGTAAATSRTTL